MSYTKSRSEYRENKRMSQLIQRAKNDPAVHKQLIDVMEEDPELIKAFSKHTEAIYGTKWHTMSSSDKSKLIKSEMEKNRIPRKKGGRKTKKARKTKRSYFRTQYARKTKRRNNRKKSTRKRK
jgi:hypothetical protein